MSPPSPEAAGAEATAHMQDEEAVARRRGQAEAHAWGLRAAVTQQSPRVHTLLLSLQAFQTVPF